MSSVSPAPPHPTSPSLAVCLRFPTCVRGTDPWFNFRATQYLVDNGWHAFFHWFDHSVWYPLGRPISTTIYPAMQIVAACIHALLRAAGWGWSLEDVCCFVPVWFGMSATLFTSLLAFETSGRSLSAGAVGAGVMAVLPAHLSRSVGGGFDNESVAITGVLPRAEHRSSSSLTPLPLDLLHLNATPSRACPPLPSHKSHHKISLC